MMKKIFALLVATVMLLAFSNIAFAANDYSMSVEYWDIDEENLIEDLSELKVGDQFYVYVYLSEIPSTFTAFSSIVEMNKDVIDMVFDEEEESYLFYTPHKTKKNTFWALECASNATGGYTFKYVGSAVNKSGTYAFDSELPLYAFVCEVKGEGTSALTTRTTGFADESNTEYFPTAEVAEEITIGSGESEETTVAAEAVLTDVAEAEVEMGQAVSMTFSSADLQSFTGMNWKINFQTKGTKYAKVDYPAETIASIEEATPVQFVAAFLVKKNGGELDPIESISAGFCDETLELVAETATFGVTNAPAAE